MKKKSMRQMLELIADSVVPGEDVEPAAPSAAERLGRAMLERFGGVDDDVTEDELVDAILDAWDMSEDTAPEEEEDESAPADEPEEPEEEEPEEEEPEEEPVLPFGTERRPVPMRTGSSAAAPVDYADMSAKQFNDLKKLLKKASADGKRIRL